MLNTFDISGYSLFDWILLRSHSKFNLDYYFFSKKGNHWKIIFLFLANSINGNCISLATKRQPII